MLTLSLMLQSAPLVRSSFTWSACLYSVAQIMGVQPPSSCGKLIMGLKISWRNTETTSIQLHLGIPILKKKQKQQQLRRKAQLLIFSPPEYRVVIKERLLHYVKAVLMLHIASSYILIQDTCSRAQHVMHQLFPENLLSPVTKCFTVKIHTGNPS